MAPFEKGFRDAFRTSGIEGCVSSASKSAELGIDTTLICTCVVETLLAKHTVEELSHSPSHSELTAITEECVKAHPPFVDPRKTTAYDEVVPETNPMRAAHIVLSWRSKSVSA